MGIVLDVVLWLLLSAVPLMLVALVVLAPQFLRGREVWALAGFVLGFLPKFAVSVVSVKLPVPLSASVVEPLKGGTLAVRLQIPFLRKVYLVYNVLLTD